uniref:Uncharacterized protein n=1 Tax=Romanomermis culicivorax TaxID=13658 RepID=A0A915ID61_ROMCU
MSNNSSKFENIKFTVSDGTIALFISVNVDDDDDVVSCDGSTVVVFDADVGVVVDFVVVADGGEDVVFAEAAAVVDDVKEKLALVNRRDDFFCSLALTLRTPSGGVEGGDVVRLNIELPLLQGDDAVDRSAVAAAPN